MLKATWGYSAQAPLKFEVRSDSKPFGILFSKILFILNASARDLRNV